MTTQNFGSATQKSPTGGVGFAAGDLVGNQMVSMGGLTTLLNLTAATLVKVGATRAARVSVIVAGSAAGTVNDIAVAANAAASNQFGTIPNTVGTYVFDWPCAVGLVVVPGTGQTLAVSYT